MDILGTTVTPKMTMITPEGRLRFFFPGQVAQTYPRDCGDLSAYDIFILPRGSSAEEYFATEVGVPGTVEYWSSCRSPLLTLVSQTDAYAIFRVD
jgi:hypothetical protein